MNFLGMGAMEIIVIMVIALIIFGPDKLPEMGAQAGKALRDLRNMTREMTGEFEESITDVRGAMDDMKSTVAEVQRDTRDLAVSVTEITDSAAAEVRAGVRTVDAETAAVNATVQSATPVAVGGNSASNLTSGAKSVIPSSPQTKVAQPAPKAQQSEQKNGPILPTKKDPLGDLGGSDIG